MMEQSIAKKEGAAGEEAKTAQGAYGYHLMLLSDDNELRELWLPANPAGFYRFSTESDLRFLTIEAVNDRWVAKCSPPAFFSNVPPDCYCEVTLHDGQLLNLDYDEIPYSIYVEEVTADRLVFNNHSIIPEVEISIGSDPECDIYYMGNCAPLQAVIVKTKYSCTIKAFGENGYVYVNGKKVSVSGLNLGDVVSIMDLRIIIGAGFISVNDGSGKVKINDRILREEIIGYGGRNYYSGQYTEEKRNYFNRKPRRKIESEELTITIEAPPMSMNNSQIPLVLRMGGSMVMGGMSALSGNFTTLISSVLFPFISSKFTEQQRKDYEARRLEKYTEYLEKKKREIEEACYNEKRILNMNFPEINKVIADAEGEMRIWERRPIDSDFLCLRLGCGEKELGAVLDYPQRGFDMDNDDLEEKMYEIAEKKYIISNVPVVLSLTEDRICGMLGERKDIIELVQQLILQAAVFHSYDEVKIVLLAEENELQKLDAVRFLPHVWDDKRSIRFIGTNETEAFKIGEYIKGQLPEKIEEREELQQIAKERSYYLIFALDKKLLDGHEVFKDITQADHNIGVSVFAAYDDLPKDCQKIIELSRSGSHKLMSMQKNGGEDRLFTMDGCAPSEVSDAMKLLSNIKIKTVDQEQELPKTVPFLDMMQAGTIEQLNPLKRWRENNPVKSLAAPVGVGVDGSLFNLDLHEKRQGPHGLVAGMTGSGKSEFLITYILSMAVNYHPDEVAFVLIDYKGGGLAGAFENPRTGVKLPHLIGTITNLDGAAIQRSLVSIESELKRRQRLFNKVNSLTNEGTIDIYAYQKLYRAGKIDTPLPHLFIISDEFAELKQQQPEFMEKLISAARIGRSLGVHLILATQKPAGVVNDQIRSNTKFRVCLRVQDKSDSMDMLKRGEAAELTDTGRFYLQVGYNEYFAMGQSAWCGAEYEPTETVKVKVDETIEFIDVTGQTIAKAKAEVKKTATNTKQLVAIVKYLSDLAEQQGIESKSLWQPALSSTIDFEELNEEYKEDIADSKYKICLGMMDDPENQEQFPKITDIAYPAHTLIVGNSGSGKTNVLYSLICSMAEKCSPEEINFYILDYSARMMKMFKKLPHCGGILYEEDEESLDDFFDMINSFIAERKQLFTELEVDSFEAARAVRKLPLIVVIVDNFAGMTATKRGESHSYKFQGYLKNSVNLGIKFIVTTSHLNEINNKNRQEMEERIAFNLKDKYDYNDMIGCKVQYIPPDMPGRGLLNYEGRPLEFHAAMICAHEDEKSRIQYIKDKIESIESRYTSVDSVRHMAVMDEEAEFADFAAQFKRGRIPLGYHMASAKAIALPLKQLSTLGIYFGNPGGRVPVIKNIIYAAQREGIELWVLKRNKDSIFDNELPAETLKNADFLDCTDENVRLLQKAVYGMMLQRSQHLKEKGLDNFSEEKRAEIFDTLNEFGPPIMLFIESFNDFCGVVSAMASMSFRSLFENAAKKNIYVVCCFEDELSKEAANNILIPFFGKNEVLLFGGQLNKQTLCMLPSSPNTDKMLAYNVALMQYRGTKYPLLMPCGKIEKVKVDKDMESIF